MLRRTKAKLKSLLTQPPGPDPFIAQVIEEQVLALPESRIKIGRSREETAQNGLLPDAPFADFLGHYSRLAEPGGHNGEALAQERKDHPFLCDFAALAISFLNECDRLPQTLAPLLKRHFYRFISILNSKDSARIFDYKVGLPKVGLCYFPNPGPRQFVIDALAGMADIIDMEPGKLVEKVWQLKQYNFDYAQYQKTFNQRIESEIALLGDDFIARFPSKQWLVKELAASVQYQWALNELLKLRYFDVIFLGAGEVPLALALYDMPQELMPPLVSLGHGMPAGDPVMGFFLRIDRVVVRSAPEREFYADLGVPADKVLEVGSISVEDLASQAALLHNRRNARYALGLDDEDTVILYATTYDIGLYDSKSCAEILDLMIASFTQCLEKHQLKNPVLYIKYHPSPSSDPTYSFSRSQYPLQAFSKLIKLGYRVRLTDSLTSVLPACDCFIAHESTTLADALDFGIPTLSIKLHTGLSKLFLGALAYSETDCHKTLSVYDSPTDIAQQLYHVCTMDKDTVYAQSKHLWSSTFCCGRTEGLMKVAELVSSLIAKS